jgi:hypothetical protein
MGAVPAPPPSRGSDGQRGGLELQGYGGQAPPPSRGNEGQRNKARFLYLSASVSVAARIPVPPSIPCPPSLPSTT